MKHAREIGKMVLVTALASVVLTACSKKGVDVDHGKDNAGAAPAANTSIPAASDTIGGHNGTTAAPPGSTGGTPEALGDHVSTGTGTGTTHTGAAGTPSDAAKDNAEPVPSK